MSTKPDVLAGDMPVADASALDETGNRVPQGIRRSVRSHYPQIRACYERGLGRHPTLRGRVMLRFVIDRDGTISELVVADNQVPDCSVVHCLRETMARVTFSPASVITTVQYPIVFEPAD
ncbi:MAG TPA: AgmX/PglI C-terminal domain-containing protein [Polyangiaceae bacterium]|nr:AgmX/PglI C-terminal domain-containing protein [Polyangiaceae bacterium]